MLRFFILWVCIFEMTGNAAGQTNIINQLKNEIESVGSPEIKLQAIFAFCEQRQSLPTDTLCKYANIARQLSLGSNNPVNRAVAEYYIASCLVKQGGLDSAFKICEQNIEKLKNEKGSSDALMKLTGLKGQILIRSSRYKEGLGEIYKVLNTAEQQNDIMMQMAAKNAIGWVNMEMDQPHEALKWFFRALNTTDNKVRHEKNCNIYSNIAAVYKQLHQNDSAEYYIKIAIDFSRRIENLFFLANSLNILADIYIDSKRPAFAEAPLKEALVIRKQIGDPFYIVSDMSQLAVYYASIKDTVKGRALSLEGIKMAKELNMSSKLPFLYYALGENYKAAENYLQYSQTVETIMALKDSMYAATSAEEKSKLETQYLMGEKENLILRQKLQIANKNYLIYGSAVFLLLTAIVAWLFFKGYQKNQQIKLLTMQAEQKQAEALAVRSAEENERKRISRDLHDNIGAYATVLMANTEELRKQASAPGVQEAVKAVSENAEHIIGSLRETIWVLNNDEITVTDFIDRFKLYARKMMESYRRVNIIFEEQLTNDAALSPAEAFNIFRIMQEALQNVLKHGAARNIVVKATSTEKFILSIRDDGKGFDIQNISHGNGLYNMQHRAKESGYAFNVFSGAGGTEVVLEKNNSLAV